MTGAVAPAAVTPAAESVWFEYVLAGVALAGPAAELGGRLDPGFLTDAGWDPVSRVLSPPAEHPLLGRTVCRVGGCTSTAHGGRAGIVCSSCRARLTAAGAERAADRRNGPAAVAGLPGGVRRPGVPADAAVTAGQVVRLAFPPVPPPAAGDVGGAVRGRSADQAVADAGTLSGRGLRPSNRMGPELLPEPLPAVAFRGGSRRRHRPVALAGDPVRGRRGRPGEPARASAACGHRGAVRSAQQRVRGGAKIYDATLRAVCDTLRREQAPTISACPVESVPGRPARALLTAMARDVRRALTDPARERAGDDWDLAVFGHRGRLSFTGISQPWLARAAKAWAGEELPRHRGGGAIKVREKVNALARLSESLRARDDHGLTPDQLGRNDIEAFLNRLAYLESTGTISRYHRNVICRDTRYALSGIRALGLTRPGQVAAGLPGDFALGRGDIPAEPARGEPGRDLPPEIMAVLCAHLDSLHPVEVRTATQIGIDTGRRPEDILNLPVDCLRRDTDGCRGAGLRQRQGRPTRSPPADQPGHRRGDHRPAGTGPGAFPRHPAR